MLRPEPMTRVLVVGPKDQLERVIETLYELRLVHLVDHHGEDGVISTGEPPEVGDLRAQIATLEVNLREEDEGRKKVEALLQDLDRRIDELAPFASLGLPLDVYRGYDHLEVLVGRVATEVHGIEAVTPDFEMFAADGVVAVFVTKAQAERVREHLVPFGFAQLEIPAGEGDPAQLLARARDDRDKWTARVAEMQERIGKLRDRYARFLMKAEDLLQTQIEKAEAPLRFAVSEHSFVIDGWVPTSRVAPAKAALAALPGLFVDAV